MVHRTDGVGTLGSKTLMALKRKSRPAPPRMSNLHDIQIKVSPRSPRATKATAVSNTETVAVSAAKSTQAPCGRPCVQSRPSRLNGMHGTCLGLNRPQEHESGPMVQTTDVRDYVHSYMQPCTQVQSKATLENSEQCLRTLMEPMICANTMRDIYIYTHTHTLNSTSKSHLKAILGTGFSDPEK